MHRNRALAVALGLGLAVATLAGCGEEAAEPSGDAFCSKLTPLTDLGVQLQSEDADLTALAEQVRDLAAVAPTAVQPSVTTIADAVTTMAEAAEASGEEGTAALAAAFSAIEGEREELERASLTVEGFALRECGIDLTPDATPAPENSDEPESSGTPAETAP